MNLTLCSPNRIDAAAVSGGSWMPSLPLANVKDPRISKLARSVNTALGSTVCNIDLLAPRAIGAISLINTNFSVTAKIRITGDDASNFATPVYSSGWFNVFPSGVIPYELLEWEDDNFWLGTVSAEAVAGYKSPVVKLIPSRPVLRYWRIEIDDTTNPAGSIHVGRIFISDIWTLANNFSFGEALGFSDETQFDPSLGGREEYCDAKPTRRIYDFSVDWLEEHEAYARVIDMQRLSGVKGEMFVIPDGDDLVNGFRRNFLCRSENLSPMINENVLKKSVKFRFREIM